MLCLEKLYKEAADEADNGFDTINVTQTMNYDIIELFRNKKRF